ncbi:MAG TPA: metallophosphoesterase [Balneolales bacterium]|nr:metallophosphoesterase [Balneolales bacterium]
MDRKTFIRTLAGGIVGLATGGGFFNTVSARGFRRITILNTNDTHGHIEPFPPYAGKYAGLGGVARRKTLIDQIRAQNPHTLLLDAGDAFQGTPFFEEFRGGLCYHFMSELGYDAATLGNHDFDDGVDGWVSDARRANFPFVSSNYQISNAAMRKRVQRYLVKDVDGIRIGVFGLGIAFKGLVTPQNHKGVTYEDPVPVARETIRILRENERCDFVICLSHLGFKYPDDRISDMRLARRVTGIDLIIGGHTHTFLQSPVPVQTTPKWRTLVTQVGFGGIVLGRIDFYFDQKKKQPDYLAMNTIVGPGNRDDEKIEKYGNGVSKS